MRVKQMLVNLVGMIFFGDIFLSGCQREYKVGFVYKYFMLLWGYIMYVNCL